MKMCITLYPRCGRCKLLFRPGLKPFRASAVRLPHVRFTKHNIGEYDVIRLLSACHGVERCGMDVSQREEQLLTADDTVASLGLVFVALPPLPPPADDREDGAPGHVGRQCRAAWRADLCEYLIVGCYY